MKKLFVILCIFTLIGVNMVSASENIAQQTQTVYDDYNKLKKLVDVGYFLEDYVVSGGVVTKDVTYNNRINATELVAALDNDVTRHEAISFTTTVASATYYLDYKTGGEYSFETSHPSGSYLPIAEVTTDVNKNVSAITDRRGDVGGFRLKSGYMYPEITELQNDLADLAGAGRTTETVKGNADNIIALQTEIQDKAMRRTSALYNNAVTESGADTSADALTVARTALSKGSIKIAFWGDSITEGDDQTDTRDAYAERFIRALRDKYPNVTIEYQNYSLSGRTLADAVNPTYANYSDRPRPWVTDPNKVWRTYVQDYAPDLVIVAFGMNDSNGSKAFAYGLDNYFATNLDTMKTFVNTWTKVPSVCLVSTILPTTDIAAVQQELPGFDQSQEVTQAVARTTRQYAKSNNFALADANRLYLLLRDGTDDVLRKSDAEFNWEGYSSSDWTGDKANFSLASNILTPNSTNKFITRARNYYEGTIELDFTPQVNGADGVLWVGYRKDTDLGYLLWTISPSTTNGASDSSIKLWSMTAAGNVTLSDVSAGIINTGTKYNLTIESVGNKHTLSINGTVIQVFKTYHIMHDGQVYLGSSGACPILENLSISFEDSLFDRPMYSQADLIGELPYTDTTSSGDGIHHPTGLGHAVTYLPSLFGLMNGMDVPLPTIPAVEVAYSSTLSVATGVETQLSFSEVFDNYNMFDSGNPNRIVIQKAGMYVVTATARYDNVSGGNAMLNLYVDGVRVTDKIVLDTWNDLNCSICMYCDVGDEITLKTIHSNAGSINLLGAKLSAVAQ